MKLERILCVFLGVSALFTVVDVIQCNVQRTNVGIQLSRTLNVFHTIGEEEFLDYIIESCSEVDLQLEEDDVLLDVDRRNDEITVEVSFVRDIRVLLWTLEREIVVTETATLLDV